MYINLCFVNWADSFLLLLKLLFSTFIYVPWWIICRNVPALFLLIQSVLGICNYAHLFQKHSHDWQFVGGGMFCWPQKVLFVRACRVSVHLLMPCKVVHGPGFVSTKILFKYVTDQLAGWRFGWLTCWGLTGWMTFTWLMVCCWWVD